MRRSLLFFIAVAATLICLLMAAYFLVPGIYHPYISLSSGHPTLVDAAKHPRVVLSSHRFYAAAFFVLAAILATGAFLFRPKKTAGVAMK